MMTRGRRGAAVSPTGARRTVTVAGLSRVTSIASVSARAASGQWTDAANAAAQNVVIRPDPVLVTLSSDKRPDNRWGQVLMNTISTLPGLIVPGLPAFGRLATGTKRSLRALGAASPLP